MILRPGFYNCDAAWGVTSSGLSCRHIAAARRGGGGSRRFVFFPRANFGSEQSCRDAAGAITIMNAKAHSKFPPALARAIAVSGWNRVPPPSQSTTTCIETMENSLRSLPQLQTTCSPFSSCDFFLSRGIFLVFQGSIDHSCSAGLGEDQQISSMRICLYGGS